ncbi:TetR/AcrR family transcriptional regulator [Streptomyces spongiae]|uniref:TetR/AcrR family transcriptional regulator n=1 Tax=Streptomyces spongiae TaxID=565072 RepID=A0A5N8X9R9_9ACTN|nr:TetR/AcrR family transcriptional regulator [Streptomyces spongiae]MPY56193.1 TetR/AcrR family transcriptional regulator [Streptomyces spongiae]
MTRSAGAPNPQVARSRAAALNAGRELLVSGGWDAVTYVTVAERSGVGRTTLYRHWPTIEQFLRDLLLSQCAVSHHSPAGDTREDLIAELDGFRLQLYDPAVVRPMVTIMERASHDPEFAHLGGELYTTCSHTVAQIVQAAQENEEVDGTLDISRAVAELSGPLLFHRLLGREDTTREFVIGLVDDFLRAHRPGTDSG